MINSIRFFQTAVVYMRLYKKESRNTSAFDEHEKIVRERTSVAHGFRVLEIFKENSVTGNPFDRPAFIEMVEYIQANRGKIRYLIVGNINRISFERAELRRVRDFLRINRIRLVSLDLQRQKQPSKQANLWS